MADLYVTPHERERVVQRFVAVPGGHAKEIASGSDADDPLDVYAPRRAASALGVRVRMADAGGYWREEVAVTG